MLKASWAGNLSVLLHAEPFREVLPLPCPDLVPRAKTIILGVCSLPEGSEAVVG